MPNWAERTIFVEVTHLGLVAVVLLAVLGRGGLDSLLDADGVLVMRGADARGFDSLVDADGFLDNGGSAVVVAVAVDNCLVYTDGLFEGGGGPAVAVAVNNCLVYTNSFCNRRGGPAVAVSVNNSLFYTGGLLEGGTALVLMVVAAVNNAFGYADVLTVAWLVASTVFTLDLVDGAEVLVVLVVRVMVVVAVSVDLNARINVGGASRSVPTGLMSAFTFHGRTRWLRVPWTKEISRTHGASRSRSKQKQIDARLLPRARWAPRGRGETASAGDDVIWPKQVGAGRSKRLQRKQMGIGNT